MADTWIPSADDPRAQSSYGNGEKGMLTGRLEHYRLTLEMKCEGLTAEQMGTRSVPPSDLSLLGMVQHMSRVEHRWFRCVLGGTPEAPRIHEDGTGGFTDVTATDEGVTKAWLEWRAEVEHARRVWEEWPVVNLDATVLTGHGHGQTELTTVREVVLHVVEAYARHMGHVDLLRECLDGRTGQ